jgi:transcriptional regulator GlxA family with amidase domain
VLLLANSPGVVVASGGLMVLAERAIDDCPPLDVLVVPGGWGTRRLLDDEHVIGWLAKTGASVPLLTSVCTGSLLVGRAGLLKGKRATTHWRSLDMMRELFPETTVVDDEHVVAEGDLLTSAGISAGIDMALRVVARHHGEAVARATARHMEYPYPDDNRRRS